MAVTWLARLDRWSAWASLWLFRLGVYGGLPALVALVTLDVLLRYFFNAPQRFIRDANGLLLLITLFAALPHAWDEGYHIRMEIFYARFSNALRGAADVVTAVSGIVVFGLLAGQGFRFLPYMSATTETAEDLPILLWPFMGFMALSSVVFVARLLSNPKGTGEGAASWM